MPAEATVKIPVGVERAGHTLYYSQKVKSGYTLVQSVKVDAEGDITVKQDHCSTYVITSVDVSKITIEKETTTEKVATEEETTADGGEKNDNDGIDVWVVVLIIAAVVAIIGSGVGVIIYRKKENKVKITS